MGSLPSLLLWRAVHDCCRSYNVCRQLPQQLAHLKFLTSLDLRYALRDPHLFVPQHWGQQH